MNKKVRLEKDQTNVDQYKRCLRYIFLNSQNINLKLVKEGEAVAKFYPCFTGVILSTNLYKFVQDLEDYYLNKTIRIVGKIKEYQSRPEIVLETPDQIELGK